jgi:hypothetical protein
MDSGISATPVVAFVCFCFAKAKQKQWHDKADEVRIQSIRFSSAKWGVAEIQRAKP